MNLFCRNKIILFGSSDLQCIFVRVVHCEIINLCISVLSINDVIWTQGFISSFILRYYFNNETGDFQFNKKEIQVSSLSKQCVINSKWFQNFLECRDKEIFACKFETIQIICETMTQCHMILFNSIFFSFGKQIFGTKRGVQKKLSHILFEWTFAVKKNTTKT